jgi:hypothetical protein
MAHGLPRPPANGHQPHRHQPPHALAADRMALTAKMPEMPAQPRRAVVADRLAQQAGRNENLVPHHKGLVGPMSGGVNSVPVRHELTVSGAARVMTCVIDSTLLSSIST